MKQKKGAAGKKPVKKAAGKKPQVSNYDFRKNSAAIQTDRVVRDYDFKKPKTFTKELLRGLNTVNEHIVRIFSSNLSALLRVFCEVTQIKMQECRYSEFLNTLPDKTLIGIIDMNDEESKENKCSMMAYFPSTFDFFMIDILLGGNGSSYKFERGFTDIEIAILEHFYFKVTNYLTEAWKNLADLKCELTSYETNPRLAQFIALEDSVVVMSFQVKVRDITDVFSFCIPALSLDGMLREADSKRSRNNSNRLEGEKEIQRRERLETSLQSSTMELTAVLDTLHLDMQDIINLEVSDVIPLNKRIDENVLLTVEGEPMFIVRVGDRKIKKSVKICGMASSSDVSAFYNEY